MTEFIPFAAWVGRIYGDKKMMELVKLYSEYLGGPEVFDRELKKVEESING